MTAEERQEAMDAAIVERAAEMIVEEIRAKAGGGFEDLIGLPVAFVGPLIGLSTEQTRRRMPVIKASERDSRVSLTEVRKFVAANTHQPQTNGRKARI